MEGTIRISRVLVCLLGCILIGAAFSMTYQIYKPVPGEHHHVPNLFGGVLITAVATVGGVLVANGVRRWLNPRNSIARHVLSSIVFAWAALTPSVVYLTTFTNAEVSSRWSAYESWYIWAAGITLLLSVFHASFRLIMAAIDPGWGDGV